MASVKKVKLPSRISVAYSRIRGGGGRMHRTGDSTAEEDGPFPGYLYYVTGTGAKIGTLTGRFLIEKEIVKPCSDGLFEGQSQSFEAISERKFEDFKARYESV